MELYLNLKNYFMKNLIILIIAITISSCSVDDNSKTKVSGLEGTYRLTSYTVENPYDLNADGTATTNIIAETNCFNNNLFIFDVDNRGESQNATKLDIDLEPNSNNQYEYSLNCIDTPDNTAFFYNIEDKIVRVTSSGNTIDGTLSDDDSTITFNIANGLTLPVEDGNGGVTETMQDIVLVYTLQ